MVFWSRGDVGGDIDDGAAGIIELFVSNWDI